MADVAILNPQVEAAPTGYTIPGSQEIILKSVKASYDGTNATGDFVPTLQFVAPNGTIVAECPVGSTVTAGDSVDVTWFPRGGVAKSGGGTSGIFFDTDPQDGQFLFTETDGPAKTTAGWGTEIKDSSGHGMTLGAYGGMDGTTNTLSFLRGIQLLSDGAELNNIYIQGTNLFTIVPGAFEVQDPTTAIVFQVNTTPTHQVGFFGVIPVAQQPTPVTLADVIALLQAFGLSA
jgi:hypothetical protein